MPSDSLTWAQDYLAKGLHPIPVNPPVKGDAKTGKKALVAWKKYQTTAPTPADLSRWFAADANNIALVLGRGVIAVDLDGEGAEDLLTAAGINLPPDAPRSRTGNGYHVLLSTPEPLGDRVGLLGGPTKPQVDIRGVGYIVAPPSLHYTGHVYEWERRPAGTPPMAPDALISLIKAQGAKQGGKTTTQGSAPDSGQPRWVAEALAGVGEGKRDATCAKLAGYFLGKRMPTDIVKSVLYSFGAKCWPPFPAFEVDKTVDSVQRREGAAAEAAQPAAAFQILGYNMGSYFYLPKGARQVVELRAKEHTKLNLLALASLQYWEQAYMGKTGIQWDMAANALIRQAELAGVYDTSRIRGRGAWWEPANGTAVLHVGDAVISGGVSTPIPDLPPSRYIYEAAPPMEVDTSDPMTAGDAHLVVQLADLLSWDRPIAARLLAGWCAVAPICGALAWRPHIWVTGGAGSGKSWVMDNLIRRLVGNVGLAVQSETTEAGLRQTLGHDARPVIFDEAEGETERAQQRVQNILALVRQASSETGAVIIKGSTSGQAKTYRIRSCFAFSSISVGVQQHADATRVSVLSLTRYEGPQAIARNKATAALLSHMDDDYVRRFIARSIRMAPVIRANAVTFAAAGAAVIGSQRLGDQIGALLAGAYSLFADTLIEPADAQAWVAEQNWDEQRGVQDSNDEARCLQRVLEAVMRVQGKHAVAERSIGELVMVALGRRADAQLTPRDAEDALARSGVRAADGELVVANSHGALERILAGTPWGKGWARLLRRLPGAAATAPVRFAALRGRGTSIPLDVAGLMDTLSGTLPLSVPERACQDNAEESDVF